MFLLKCFLFTFGSRPPSRDVDVDSLLIVPGTWGCLVNLQLVRSSFSFPVSVRISFVFFALTGYVCQKLQVELAVSPFTLLLYLHAKLGVLASSWTPHRLRSSITSRLRVSSSGPTASRLAPPVRPFGNPLPLTQLLHVEGGAGAQLRWSRSTDLFQWRLRCYCVLP